jgi:D-aminopeptidase
MSPASSRACRARSTRFPAIVLPLILSFAGPLARAAGVCPGGAAPAGLERIREVMGTGRFIAYQPSALHVVDGVPTPASEESIAADLEVLRPRFDGLITYGALHGAERVPDVAARLGFRAVIMGLWNIADPLERGNVVAALQRQPGVVAGVSVGNEVLFGRRATHADLVRAMQAVRTTLPGVAIATTEPFHLWLEPQAAPLLAQADLLLANVHPVYEPWFGTAPEFNAADFVARIAARLGEAYCGPVLVKETGVPTAPLERGFTPERQAAFWRELQRQFPPSGTRAFAVFSAFDAPWRVNDAHPVPGHFPEEAHWGLYDAARQPKPAVAEIPLLARAQQGRARARELGIEVGVLAAGPLNAITDVAGVRVGNVTLIEGESVRTGATAILAHGGNLFQDKVPAAVIVGNGFGKLTGSTQVAELGEIETPIVLTNTLAVAQGVEAVVEWTLRQPGNEAVRSVNAVIGETNDGWALNDIRARTLTAGHVLKAIEGAREGPVQLGSVGAGTGTVAFGWKGGIGTSSRSLPRTLGGWTVGVLVQSNYGGILRVDGVPVGEALGGYFLEDQLADRSADGSIMIVIATDAPLSERNLGRLATRSMAGLARTGSAFTNGSGDYAIAFSTAPGVRRTPQVRAAVAAVENLPNDLFDPLSEAVIEATEEAILDSLFMATTVSSKDPFTGRTVTVEAIPLERVRAVLAKYGHAAR